MRLTLALALLLSAACTVHASPSLSNFERALAPKRRATVCNGHAELCDRGFGNVTFVGAHDSYAVGVNNLAVNQDQNITQQLNDGIRMLQMQTHVQNGVIHNCHTSCTLFDGGTLEDYLKTVKAWLDTNPNEVLSLLIVNSENRPASEYDTIFKSAGMDAVSFVPTTAAIGVSDWPTLGSMIDSGKRVVTFLDNGGGDPAFPYIMDEFSNIWETEFNVVNPSNFDCSVNRTHGDPSTQMFLINHFLDKLLFDQPVPDVANAPTTNSASGPGSLGAHVDTCVATQGRPPNFMLVDFYEFGGGSVFQVAANVNGVQFAPASPVASPVPTNSPSASVSPSSSTNEASTSFPKLWASLFVMGGVTLGFMM